MCIGFIGSTGWRADIACGDAAVVRTTMGASEGGKRWLVARALRECVCVCVNYSALWSCPVVFLYLPCCQA